jgi:hypothetical protein
MFDRGGVDIGLGNRVEGFIIGEPDDRTTASAS